MVRRFWDTCHIFANSATAVANLFTFTTGLHFYTYLEIGCRTICVPLNAAPGFPEFERLCATGSSAAGVLNLRGPKVVLTFEHVGHPLITPTVVDGRLTGNVTYPVKYHSISDRFSAAQQCGKGCLV